MNEKCKRPQHPDQRQSRNPNEIISDVLRHAMFGKIIVKISNILVVQTFACFEPNLKITGVVVFPGQTLRKLLLQCLSTVGITIDGQTRGPNTWLIAKPNF